MRAGALRWLSWAQENDEYPRIREIAEVAQFPDFGGLIVPSARSEASNVVVFCDRAGTLRECGVTDHGIVGWR